MSSVKRRYHFRHRQTGTKADPMKKHTAPHQDIASALHNLDRHMGDQQPFPMVSFEAFLEIFRSQPEIIARNVFQVFHDMVKSYVGEGMDEYPDDPESIHFILYDFNRLFVEGSDHPFFADRLFGNRFMAHVESLKRGAQQNKIYIFDGPPGCGKSTFLNNLLMRFQAYTRTPDGVRYEAVWRLKRKTLLGDGSQDAVPLFEKMVQFMDQATTHPFEPLSEDFNALRKGEHEHFKSSNRRFPDYFEEEIEIPCPSHDHPILMIPKRHRRAFLRDLFNNSEFKEVLFNEKEYEWIFMEKACTICSSIYWALSNRLKSPLTIFKMLHARPYRFNRRLGEGISVFNPGDKPLQQSLFSNDMLQKRINTLLKDSNEVKYLFSRYAKTNNGIYALMDVKSHNIERLIELHNIISEGLHKVEDIEENVNSLLIALMNPEDKKNIEDFQSFSDRIEYIRIPYVLDLNTEVAIYRDIFGKSIDGDFLPRVLNNFARAIISTRMNRKSEALIEWIGDPKKYRQYCDEDLLLLKMEIYTGHIPPWLTEEDRKRFTAKRRRKIIAESEAEGEKGLSGRDSIKIFNEFYSRYALKDRLINITALNRFFTKARKDLKKLIPEGFLESLLAMYDYAVLQEVKESLYDYNEQQIARDLKNYLFAVNFEPETEETCTFTGDKLTITEEYLKGVEHRLLGAGISRGDRISFRQDTQKLYTSKMLTQEMMLEGRTIEETELYQSLMERYVFNLKEKVLDPFVDHENFRQAIKTYGKADFKTYDRRIRDDVTFLIRNLCRNCGYTEQGAKEVCIYVVDNNLAKRYA